MARENVRCDAIKTIKKPITVKFKTKSGKIVSFRAVKSLKKRKTMR